MTLQELILKVKENKLSQQDLESYYDQMCQLDADMQIEMADLEKEEALFMNSKEDDESVASRKISWKATKSGQRLIVLKRYSLATKSMMKSLKNRIYKLI